MNKIYLVNHCFDVDGGFGDAIPQEEVICGFDNREDANGFVEKYSNPHIHDSLDNISALPTPSGMIFSFVEFIYLPPLSESLILIQFIPSSEFVR